MATKPLLKPEVDDSWMERSLCRLMGVPTDWFYTDEETKQYPYGDEVLAVCSSCSVREECVDYALRENEEFAIWGGLKADGRVKLKKQRIAERDTFLAELGPDLTAVARTLCG